MSIVQSLGALIILSLFLSMVAHPPPRRR